jgi:hypothetical protein
MPCIRLQVSNVQLAKRAHDRHEALLCMCHVACFVLGRRRVATASRSTSSSLSWFWGRCRVCASTREHQRISGGITRRHPAAGSWQLAAGAARLRRRRCASAPPGSRCRQSGSARSRQPTLSRPPRARYFWLLYRRELQLSALVSESGDSSRLSHVPCQSRATRRRVRALRSWVC